MANNHTPGPWRPRKVDNNKWEIDAPNGDPTIGHDRWAGLAVYGCDDFEESGSKVAAANARLIASAPRITKALYDLMEVIREIYKPGFPGLIEVFVESMAAYKEATGEINEAQ